MKLVFAFNERNSSNDHTSQCYSSLEPSLYLHGSLLQGPSYSQCANIISYSPVFKDLGIGTRKALLYRLAIIGYHGPDARTTLAEMATPTPVLQIIRTRRQVLRPRQLGRERGFGRARFGQARFGRAWKEP